MRGKVRPAKTGWVISDDFNRVASAVSSDVSISYLSAPGGSLGLNLFEEVLSKEDCLRAGSGDMGRRGVGPWQRRRLGCCNDFADPHSHYLLSSLGKVAK